MTRKRRKVAKINLTQEAYRQVEIAAFKNCRTVSQELTYMVEKQLERDKVAPVRNLTYDKHPVLDQEAVNRQMEAAVAMQASGTWTLEQEAMVDAAGKERGLSEAQITTVKLLHKIPEAALAAIAEEVPA